MVGDGEAETGPLAASWHSNKFLDPARDGAVLPILHLNGYKIANPTVLARIPEDELRALLRGYGYEPHFVVAGDDPAAVHRALAATLDEAVDAIAAIQRRRARGGGRPERPRWPMIVLRTPKGWTGPHEVDGLPVEGTFRAHQVPLAEVRTNPAHLALLEAWMRSYRPEELFDEAGALRRRAGRAGADGRAADERQPARQRRRAAARPGPARLPRLRRRRCPRPGGASARGDAGARRLPARRDRA